MWDHETESMPETPTMGGGGALKAAAGAWNMLSFPLPGCLCPVPGSGPGCEHPAGPPAVHVPRPDPAHRVVSRLPLHFVRHVQARAGAGAWAARGARPQHLPGAGLHGVILFQFGKEFL